MKISLKTYTKLLTSYLKNSKWHMVLLAFIIGGSIIIQLINPQIVSSFIDGVKAMKPVKSLIAGAVLFIIAALMQQLLAIASTYVSQNIGWRATNKLRLDLMEHCLSLDISFYKEHPSGEMVERIDGDVTALFNFFSRLFVDLVNNVLLMIGVVIMISMKNVYIGFAFILFLIVAFFVLGKTQGEATTYYQENREITAKFYGFIGEHMESTEDIRANGASLYVMNRFYSMVRSWLPVRLKAHLSGYKIWITFEGVFGFGYVMTFILGSYLWYTNQISIGIVYLMINYIQLLGRPLEQMRSQLQDIQKASASILRIDELLSYKTKLTEPEESKQVELKSNKVSLHVNNLSFEYEANSPILKDINFKLLEGKILGVLGHTGCGKTTLARLIVRFYDPMSGEIYLNNTSLKDISSKSLRQQIAYVTQDVQLFHASVRDNITFFNKNIADQRIIETIYQMGLSDWYENLNKGLDTIIHPGGSMSSGEAQLLTLVRVFLKDPKLVILDEASSRLDPVTEKLVDKAFQKLMEGRSCIIIAHRLGTIQKADNILILEQGSVLEYGERETLASDSNSKFYHLLQCGIEEVLV